MSSVAGSSSSSDAGLPEAVSKMRGYAHIGRDAPSHVHNIEDPAAFAAMGVDNSLTMESFRESLEIKIIHLDDESIEFDMTGIDAPLANAFRRILLSEVPTMAIEKVTLYQNTSIIQDEVLVHRLGLIPIRVDPRDFEYVEEKGKNNQHNTVVFTLQVECKASNSSTGSQADITLVHSSELKWIPQGKQKEKYKDPIRPVHDDIVIAKLCPGQSIEAELLCEKGIGRTHAKWSPVCTASYRLLPVIEVMPTVKGDVADELVKMCPAKVFDIEDLGGGQRGVKVARPRQCTMCRECIREDPWPERVKLFRKRDHFIFTVETTGVYEPAELLKEAIKVLKGKCKEILSELDGK